jgi:hypothetical protein
MYLGQFFVVRGFIGMFQKRSNHPNMAQNCVDLCHSVFFVGHEFDISWLGYTGWIRQLSRVCLDFWYHKASGSWKHPNPMRNELVALMDLP